MNNFEFEHNGKKLWYSRSLACNIIIIRYNPEESRYEVLACKRGQGCEFNKGLWNVPGGFIDFNENAKQCAIRELYEETGAVITEDAVGFYKLDTNPRGKRQTMVAVHYALMTYARTELLKFTTEHSEPGETEEIKWIAVKELKNYKWCNGQTDYILGICKDVVGLHDLGD